MDARSIELRRKIIDVVAESRCGHIPSAFSCLEIVRVLYDSILQPGDKFILSKGHGCLAQYVLLADKGYIREEELLSFCKDGALLGGHPTAPSAEVATGSLGHGLSMGIGFALAGHRTFVLMGDGECNEGSVWEAAMCAAKHNLNNLTVIIDYNQRQAYGSAGGVLPLEPLAEKWYSFGFAPYRIHGHDNNELGRIADNTYRAKPRAFICHTVKGKGIKLLEEDLRWHYKNNITDEEIESLYRGLDEKNLP